jgi:hypothetical protein
MSPTTASKEKGCRNKRGLARGTSGIKAEKIYDLLAILPIYI